MQTLMSMPVSHIFPKPLPLILNLLILDVPAVLALLLLNVPTLNECVLPAERSMIVEVVVHRYYIRGSVNAGRALYVQRLFAANCGEFVSGFVVAVSLLGKILIDLWVLVRRFYH
jgi:hypothetical protein